MTLPVPTHQEPLGPVPDGDTLEDAERAYLKRLIVENRGNYARMQKHANVARATLYRRIKVLGLEELVVSSRAGEGD